MAEPSTLSPEDLEALNPVLAQAEMAAERQRAFAATAKTALEGREERRKPYIPSPGEKYILGLLEECKRVRLATLEAFEPIWTRSILYTAGVQHLRFVTAQRQFVPEKHEDWMPQPVVNVIQPKVQRIVDFFTRNRPSCYVQSNTQEQDDLYAAEHGNNVQTHLWDLNNEHEKYNEAAHWAVITGNVFGRLVIDGSPQIAQPDPAYQFSEEPIMDPRTGGPLLGPTGQPIMTRRVQEPARMRNEQGQASPQIRSEIYGPMHYTVPLACTDFADSPWNCLVGMYPLQKLRSMFPDKADYIGEKGRLIVSDLYQHRILALLTSGVHGVIRSLDPYAMEGYGVVYQYERQPDPEFPSGMSLIALDDIPLHIGELPLRTRYSTEHCGYYKVPARFWHRGMVEDLLHIQDQINKLEQFLQLNDAFNINPMILVPDQANIPEGQLGARPGLVVRYTYPYEPKFQEGVSMPAQIIQRRGIYMEDAEEISGVRHVLVGDAPGGVKAGVALNRLGEEAEGMFSPIAKQWERFIERRETAKLEAVQLFWTIPQHITVQAGRGDIQQIEDFVGAMLRGNTRIRVQPGSYKPRSLVEAQDRMVEMFNLGILPGVMTDPEQHRAFLEVMGVDERFRSDQSLDYKRAKMENEQLKKLDRMLLVRRRSGDNDVIHLTVHTNERKKPHWDNLPNVVQQAHMMHEMEHLQAIVDSGGLEERDMLLDGTETEGLAGGDGPGTNGESKRPGADAAPGQNGGADAAMV